MQFKPLAAVMVAALTAVPGAAASGVSAVRPDTSPARSVATAPRTLPPGLPTHFGFGLSAHPDESGIDGWMPDSGIAWDYAYQYLSGGVNTGSGWQTWNTSAQFPLFYAQGASSHGYIPVFPYYQLL